MPVPLPLVFISRYLPTGGHFRRKPNLLLTKDVVKAYFYIMEKNTRKTAERKEPRSAVRRIHVNLPEEVHQKLRVKCALEDITIQDFVSELIGKTVANVRIER